MKKIRTISLLALSLIVMVFVQVPMAFSAEDCSTNDKGGQLRLPFEGVWGISQGYRGSTSHRDGDRREYSIDFNLPGLTDANQPVFAPGRGEIVNSNPSFGTNEVVCFDLDGDGLGAVEIGHLSPSRDTQIGMRYNRSDVIGTLIPGETAISSGPHIHIAYFLDNECRGLSQPFNDMFGEEVSLPDAPGYNDVWKGEFFGCGEFPPPVSPTPEDPSVWDTFAGWFGFGDDSVPTGGGESVSYVPPDYAELDTEIASLDSFVAFVVISLEKWGPESFLELFYSVIDTIMKLAVLLIVLEIVYAGFLFVMSGGNEAQIEKARSALRNLILGFAIIIGAAVVKGAIELVAYLIAV